MIDAVDSMKVHEIEVNGRLMEGFVHIIVTSPEGADDQS